MCGGRADEMRLFVVYLSNGLVQVCEIELSHIGKSNGNPNLVCENNWSVIVAFPGPQVMKVNSTEHENSTAHNNLNAEK